MVLDAVSASAERAGLLDSTVRERPRLRRRTVLVPTAAFALGCVASYALTRATGSASGGSSSQRLETTARRSGAESAAQLAAHVESLTAELAAQRRSVAELERRTGAPLAALAADEESCWAYVCPPSAAPSSEPSAAHAPSVAPSSESSVNPTSDAEDGASFIIVPRCEGRSNLSLDLNNLDSNRALSRALAWWWRRASRSEPSSIHLAALHSGDNPSVRTAS